MTKWLEKLGWYKVNWDYVLHAVMIGFAIWGFIDFLYWLDQIGVLARIVGTIGVLIVALIGFAFVITFKDRDWEQLFNLLFVVGLTVALIWWAFH